jgi:hypothetical protein
VGGKWTFIGEIRAIQGQPPVRLSDWLDLIPKRRDLVPVKDRDVIHPFTKEKLDLRASADSVRVIVGRRIVGSMHWALDDSPALIVWAKDRPDAHATVSAIAVEVARALKGELVPSRARDRS